MRCLHRVREAARDHDCFGQIDRDRGRFLSRAGADSSGWQARAYQPVRPYVARCDVRKETPGFAANLRPPAPARLQLSRPAPASPLPQRWTPKPPDQPAARCRMQAACPVAVDLESVPEAEMLW